MALIKCPECQSEVSDKANTCPKCGYPVKEIAQCEPSSTGMNICPKCGKIIAGKEKCPDCGTKMINCHCTEDDWTTIMLEGSLEKWEQQMRMKYVVNSKEYDNNLFNSRLQSEKDENDYYDNLMEKVSESSPTIKCPYCNSTNTKKITTTGRMMSIGIFGFASKKMGKQWHCNQCGSDF